MSIYLRPRSPAQPLHLPFHSGEVLLASTTVIVHLLSGLDLATAHPRLRLLNEVQLDPGPEERLRWILRTKGRKGEGQGMEAQVVAPFPDWELGVRLGVPGFVGEGPRLSLPEILLYTA